MSKEIIKKEELKIVVPLVSPEQAKKQWDEYQDLKLAILDKSDVQVIQGKEFLKKSYWRKLATCFNITTEVLEEKQQVIEGALIWHFTVKAIAPNGRSATGVGSCSQMEKSRKNTIHNTRATAETRATNRAISNLVGGGEVSAEEADQTIEQNVQEVFNPPKTASAVSEEIKRRAEGWKNKGKLV